MDRIPIAKPILGKEEEIAIREVLQSGNLVQGEKVRQFEREFASYIGVRHSIAAANGTMALDLALKSLGVGVGDEIVTPAFSFIASSNCILYQGAKPLFADIQRKTFNINPPNAAQKITPKTKAMIAVHLFGHPAEMDTLNEIAKERGITVIEDAAQAHGAQYKGRKAGGLGDIGCFSFYATKNMTTGEGGMITTNSDELARKLRLLRDHGQDGKYHHILLGYNYRMTEVTAAIGLAQLKKLDEFNKKRQENAETLTKEIKEIPGLTPPHVRDDVTHVFHQYVIRVQDDYHLDRDKLAKNLKKKGVDVAVHYPTPVYRQPVYEELGYEETTCPVTEETCKSVLSLPVHPSVTKENIRYILDVLREEAS